MYKSHTIVVTEDILSSNIKHQHFVAFNPAIPLNCPKGYSWWLSLHTLFVTSDDAVRNVHVSTASGVLTGTQVDGVHIPSLLCSIPPGQHKDGKTEYVANNLFWNKLEPDTTSTMTKMQISLSDVDRQYIDLVGCKFYIVIVMKCMKE